MRNIKINENKSLKLSNVLKYEVGAANEDCEINIDLEIQKMDSLLRVKNCLYARYIGPEEKLKFAYDKLGVYAFENDIELEGCNYTIYVDRNEEDETMVADVFMPVKE